MAKEKEKSRIFTKDADSSGGACFHKYSTKVYWIFFEQIQKAGKLVNLVGSLDGVNNRWQLILVSQSKFFKQSHFRTINQINSTDF